MSINQLKFSQALEFPFAERTVNCDGCGRLIDLLDDFWLREHEAGRLYNGKTFCFRCVQDVTKEQS
jgi:hypothetical protein